MKLTAMAPSKSPITRVITNEPVTPNTLSMLFANLKMGYENAKVNTIARIAMSFNSSVCPVLITTMTVVMAPGPVNKGVAMGKTDMSSRSAASLISSSVTLSREIFACNMFKAMRKSSTPPATRRESPVTPKIRNISSLESAKIIPAHRLP
jgi:hypothetical protein